MIDAIPLARKHFCRDAKQLFSEPFSQRSRSLKLRELPTRFFEGLLNPRRPTAGVASVPFLNISAFVRVFYFRSRPATLLPGAGGTSMSHGRCFFESQDHCNG